MSSTKPKLLKIQRSDAIRLNIQIKPESVLEYVFFEGTGCDILAQETTVSLCE